MTKPKSNKYIARDNWATLDPFERHFLRAEYRHLRKSGSHAIIAHGAINRVAGMFGFARTMGALKVRR